MDQATVPWRPLPTGPVSGIGTPNPFTTSWKVSHTAGEPAGSLFSLQVVCLSASSTRPGFLLLPGLFLLVNCLPGPPASGRFVLRPVVHLSLQRVHGRLMRQRCPRRKVLTHEEVVYGARGCFRRTANRSVLWPDVRARVVGPLLLELPRPTYFAGWRTELGRKSCVRW